MKLIEIIGPNGSGKSTLHDALLRQRVQMIGRNDALRLCASYWVGQNRSWRNRMLMLLLKFLTRSGAFSSSIEKIALKKATPPIRSVRREHAGLADVAMQLACENEKPALNRLKALAWFMNTLDEFLMLANTPLDTVVLLDESLSHMIYALSSIARFDPSLVETYYQFIPVPAAIVHVSVAADDHLDNVRRRAARGHVMPGHVDIIDDRPALVRDLEQRRKIGRIAVLALQRRNVPCIEYRSRVDDPHALIHHLDGLI